MANGRLRLVSESVMHPIVESSNRLDGDQPDVHHWAKTHRRLQEPEKSQQEMQRFRSLAGNARTSRKAKQLGHDRWVRSTCMNNLH